MPTFYRPVGGLGKVPARFRAGTFVIRGDYAARAVEVGIWAVPLRWRTWPRDCREVDGVLAVHGDADAFG